MHLGYFPTAGLPANTPAWTCELDGFDLNDFLREAAAFGSERFGFVVTPNADHLLRLHHDAGFRRCYSSASYVLFDSRFLARVLRMTRGLKVPVCTGADLTAQLLKQVILPTDRVLLLGGGALQAQELVQRYQLTDLAHYNPPMGFVREAKEVEHCLRFIEEHSPFRFCFLAVGAPQQELLAALLLQRGKARGLALCVGASIDFITGAQRRAPNWLQQLGLEWLYRLLQAPGRMAGRYLWRGPQLLALLHRTRISVRPIAQTGQ
jgi:exopolysaccharide biosynthesis WecB/TagA/CpsF family protein